MIRRRTFLGSSVAALAASQLEWPAVAATINWNPLRREIGDRLIDVRSPLVDFVRDGGRGADALFARLQNPYYLSDTPGLTQTLGWVDAWTSRPSLKAVAATSARDVAAAIRFARRTRLPLVVKGGGHSYFGNSNRANSLLVWTHAMRDIAIHDAFRPAGAPASEPAVHAVSLGAGCLWGEVYRTVTAKGRYVQGGGCLTVGTAGFVQGGGFGSLSKQFGTGAANLIEAEIVTADGRIRTVNRWHDPELWFALRGGGGGTFGVVTRLTLKTHPLPPTIGAALFEVKAKDDAAWRALIERMIAFYADSLFGPTWGEQIRFSPGRRLSITMVCHSLTQAQIEAAWAPFIAWIKVRPGAYTFASDPAFIAIPGDKFWQPATLRAIPGLVLQDDRAGSPADNIYWASNRNEAGQVLHAYQSLWLPNALLAPNRQSALVTALVDSARVWDVALHLNKGLGGGSAEAVAATRETATNPQVLDAFALLICAAEEPPAYPGIPGHAPDVAEARADSAGVTRAMAPLRALVPNGGCYVSEADYFLADWKRAHWGDHYPRLAAAKRRYDPANVFHGHHTVERA